MIIRKFATRKKWLTRWRRTSSHVPKQCLSRTLSDLLFISLFSLPVYPKRDCEKFSTSCNIFGQSPRAHRVEQLMVRKIRMTSLQEMTSNQFSRLFHVQIHRVHALIHSGLSYKKQKRHFSVLQIDLVRETHTKETHLFFACLTQKKIFIRKPYLFIELNDFFKNCIFTFISGTKQNLSCYERRKKTVQNQKV
jgi:hypothetical protein